MALSDREDFPEMKLYVALCQDRYEDDLIKIFRKPERAIEFCKRFMEDNRSRHSEIEECEIDGWLYHATYSSEGDCVRVEEVELDK